MVESDILERDKYLKNEKQKYLIKSQIYGNYYCSKLLENNLPGEIKETLSKIYATLLKDDILGIDLDQAFELIIEVPVSISAFEIRILLRKLKEILTIPEDDEILYHDEIESILDPYLDLKLKIYDNFKKSKYSKALDLVNQILSDEKISDYEKFLVFGINVKILATIYDYTEANKVADRALDLYDKLPENQKIDLKLQNEITDNYKLRNLNYLDKNDLMVTNISTFYIIKSYYLKNNGFEIEALNLIEDILPAYSISNCQLSYADLLNEKATIEYKLNNPKNALMNYQTVFKIYLSSNDLIRIQAIYSNISRIFIELNDWDSAIKFIEQSLNYPTVLGFKELLVISKAILSYKMDKYNDSIDILKKLILDDSILESKIMDNLYYYNIALIVLLIINLENSNFNIINLINKKIKILMNNDLYHKSELKNLNQFVLNIINTKNPNKSIISNIENIKIQLKLNNLPIIINQLI